MEYISHEGFKGLMSKLQASTPKGLLKEMHSMDHDSHGEHKKLSASEVEEGNAFTAGLAKTKKGGEFKVDGKTVKDTSNYDASMKESHPANDKWYEEFQDAISEMGLAGEAEARVMKALDHTDPLTQYGNMPAAQAAAEFVDDLGISAYEPGDYDDYDADYEEPRDDFDMAGDFNDGEFWEGKMKEEVDPNKSYHGSSANQGDTGETVDFTVIENTPEYFKIDYVITPNSNRKPMGASKYYTREKKYGEWKISKVGDKGRPLTDYEKTQLNIKGDHFGVNGKEFVQDVYGDAKTDMPGFGGTYDALDKIGIREDEEGKPNMHSDREVAKVVAQKHGKELRDLIDIYDTRSDADSKVRNQAWKDFENAAIGWAGHEMLESGMNKVAVRNLLSGYGYFEDWIPDYLDALKGELRGMDEGLHMPPLQATGASIQTVEEVTNETNPPYGFSVLSPDERKQLKEYIESLKTIKKEIGSLLEKAGKSSMMENDKAGYEKGGEIKNPKKAHDSKVPAATKAKYQEPSHKSKPGGNRTGLVMTKAEMWENEGHQHQDIEASLGEKLHTALHKVTNMAIEKLVADGWNPDEAINFLQHEIEEKGREAVMAQHDPY